MLFELIWGYRFLYRDLNDLLSKNRKLETHFQELLDRKGQAMRAGIAHLRHDDFDHYLFLDSDGQHPAELIGPFMQGSIARPETMVLGRPVFDASAPLLRVRAALESIPTQVKSGGKMAEAMAATGVFEPLALNLVRVGEETGRLGPMLLELARVFNREVETSIKRGLTLLEPLLILTLGLVIASIIVSIMLGILSVNDLAV